MDLEDQSRKTIIFQVTLGSVDVQTGFGQRSEHLFFLLSKTSLLSPVHNHVLTSCLGTTTDSIRSLWISGGIESSPGLGIRELTVGLG